MWELFFWKKPKIYVNFTVTLPVGSQIRFWNWSKKVEFTGLKRVYLNLKGSKVRNVTTNSIRHLVNMQLSSWCFFKTEYSENLDAICFFKSISEWVARPTFFSEDWHGNALWLPKSIWPHFLHNRRYWRDCRLQPQKRWKKKQNWESFLHRN